MNKNLPTPHVIHLGKKSRKQIKKFKKGYGAMHHEVQSVIAQANEQVGPDKEVLPIVVTHGRKRRKKDRIKDFHRGKW